MRFYHFTSPANALLIGLGDDGLVPGLGRALYTLDDTDRRAGLSGDEHADQTFGAPVVWLTKQESNLATAQNVAAVHEASGHKIEVGQIMFGGPVRCWIEIERSKHLKSYGDFLRTCTRSAFDPVTDEVIDTPWEVLCRWRQRFPQSLHVWWLCERAIPGSKVWVPLTRAQAIEGCECHIERCRSADASDTYWTGLRDQFAAAPDGNLFLLHAGKCEAFELDAA